MADELPCSTSQSVTMLLLGAVIGSVIFAVLLDDCKRKIPKSVWLKLGAP